MRYFLFPILLIVVFSCNTVEIVEQNIQEEIKEDENDVFINFLDSEWEKTLNNNPLFATYIGDKRSNNIINSNSIKQFFIEKDSSIESLNNLKKINFSKLSNENKLNYKLYEFGINRDIDLRNFPTYFLRINQRGGIQSFYETGNRLVYSSIQDYYDWLSRLNIFSENIDNFIMQSSKFLKKSGIMFVATLNQTLKSYLFAIIGAEYVLRWLPIGTHEWEKFVKPENLISICQKNSLKLKRIDGMKFNPLFDQWKVSSDKSVNYITEFEKV